MLSYKIVVREKEAMSYISLLTQNKIKVKVKSNQEK